MKKIFLLLFLVTISLGYSQPVSGPTAPPARNSWDVLSVFSDTYTPVSGTRNYNPGWGQAGTGALINLGAGDNVWRAQNLNYQGLDFGSNVNATAMTTFHVDVWTGSTLTETTLQFFQINNGGGERFVQLNTLSPLVANSWVSYDIPITSWTSQSGFQVNQLFQFKIVGSGGKTVYLDNMYFYRAATLQPPTIGALTVPAKTVGDAAFNLTDPTSNSTGAFTYTSSNTAVATVSGNTVTVVGAGTSTITATQASDGTYGSGSVTATLTVNFASPTVAAATPTDPSGNVISIYSNAYTPTAGVNLNPNWGQAGFGSANTTTYSVAGNSTLYYPNFNYQGTSFTALASMGTYNKVHLDVWSPNISFLQFTLIPTTGAEQFITIPVTPNTWNNVDILLSAYVAKSATIFSNTIKEIKYVNVNAAGAQQSGGILYVDNVYFSNVVSNVNPLIYNFSVPSKLNGAASFALTAPTSNSPGAFTYTSSNPAVATISGNTVTITGAGTSVITATQAASGSYNSGSITANFVVNPGATTAAPTPPARNSWDVISYYSDAYTPTATPTWGGQNAGITIAGNATRFLNDYMFGQIAFANKDISAMSTMHIDIYSVDQNPTWIWLNSVRYIATTPINGWTSLDIPLSTFGNAAFLSAINIVKIENPNGAGGLRNAYIDNIYFYRAATTQPPTLGAFTVPAKLVGDAPFNLTAPTSNSAGAFTYTSSNPAVATISGNTVTIVGIGSTTITATQAADGGYSSGSTTATLTVKYPAPTVAAPTPPARNSWDVVSVYSGAYTPAAGTRNYNPNWGQSGFANFAQPTPGGDQVLNYSGVNYQGIDIGSTLNLTTAGMTHVHIDIWTTDRPSTDFRIIDGADRSKILTTPGGQWNSFDIPLTDFVSLNKANVIQFKFQANPFGGTSEWFIDNIYFWRAQTTPPPTLGALTVPAKLTTDAPFALTAPTSNTSGAWTYTSSNTAVATISGNTVTIVGNGTSVITATQAAADGYSSGSVTANLVVSFPPPTVAAPTPTVSSGNVISLFSNAYTNQAGTDFFPNWGQQTVVTDVTIAGNATKKYTNLNYQGTQFTTINASTQHSIHFDLWSPNCTAVKISLISNTGGGEKAVVVPTTPLNTWKSYDLLMSQFSSQGLNLTGIFQIKIENWTNGIQTTGGELYLDNIYFSNVVTNVNPIITGFTIPIKLVGDAPFNLTAPTSTSAGAFTYTSSNTNVATISGSTVTVIGAGTSVITATQAANGSYNSGSITANLLVSGNPTISAGNPTRMISQVKSVYSNAYTNIATSYDNYGGPATGSSVAVSSNTTLKIVSMGRLGINLTGGLDVSNMKNIHLDIYSPNVTKFNLILFNYSAGNPQTLYPLTTTLNGWNRFDLSITGQTKVDQILLVASPDTINTIASTTTTGVAYVDNIYFWTDTLLTQLRPGYCGKTLQSLTSPIEASPLAGATEYTFEVTRISNSVVNTVVSPIYYFNPATSIPGGLVWGASYSIKVKAKISGIYQPYGNTCIVTAPSNSSALSTTQIRPFQCGQTLKYINSRVETSPLVGAMQYEFEVTPAGGSPTLVLSPLYHFSLYSITGEPQYNKQYSIRVRAFISGGIGWTGYGSTCIVTTPPAPINRMSNSALTNVFEVNAFPNPFATNFKLNIETSSDDSIVMKVYDMIGRQLEMKNATATELSNQEIGNNYPSGIYNILLKQGENVKSIRMVKR